MEFERAMADPAAQFRRPSDVLTATGLSRDQRVKILRQWEYDLMQLEVATEENMGAAGSDRTRLSDVHEALRALGDTGEDHPGPTKYG